MEQSTLKLIFNPFYSTKPPGEGSGLGLAMCKRYVDLWGGSLIAESEHQKYTKFTIYLPITNNNLTN